MRRFLALLAFFSLVLAAGAQSVYWQGSPDDPSQVQLVFEGCSPDGDPRLPTLIDNSLTLMGNSSETSMNNGEFSRSYILLYSVRARRAGATLQIPAFTVQTSKGPKAVAAYTGGAAHVISDATANARLRTGSSTVWVGEVFPLTYVLDAAQRSFSQLGSELDWNPAPLIVESWSKPEASRVDLNGEPRINIIYRSRGYAKNAGTLSLNPTTQLVNIATGSIGFGLFQQQRIEQLSVNSKRPELIVRPLPTPPAGFTGAVGQFKLASKIVPRTAAVGDPITWTLELSGTGNWPDIPGLPQREVSKDFQVVQPQAKRTPADGKLFDVTLSEDVVLVPTRPGTYALNPVTFIYFDPRSGDYKTLTTERTTVTVTPSAASASPASGVKTGTAANPPATTGEMPSTPSVPAPPSTIPREPLPGAAHARVPWSLDVLVSWIVAPFVLLALAWAWLAVQRARVNDPQRARREARARLAATLARLRTANESDRAARLIAWQRDTAILWEISHASPAATALPDEAWRQLWTESDRALYRANTDLPSDWIARAEAALDGKRVPAFSPLSGLRLRNLAPFALIVLAALLVPALRAEDAAAAYRRGDFAAAEKTWTAELAKNPANPVARHNLSLALAQQDRWDQSLAQATAALVQDPASEPIRWQFELAGEKAGFLPAPLAAFSKPGPVQSLAELASPGGWQRGLVGAAFGLALALGLLLYNGYRGASRLRSVGALAVLALSVATAAAALMSLHEYGPTVDARAVIVWRGSLLRSIPTEADTTQKSTTLAAGSVAIVEKTFPLGWSRVSFENGQTGWVRQDDLVPLWK